MLNKKYARFHILYTVRYLKYGLLLCLVPMIQALMAFDLASFATALTQDIYILLTCVIVALVMWFRTGFWVQNDAVCVVYGVIVRQQRVYNKKNIAVIDIQRPLHCRFLGASKVTIYFKNYKVPKSVTFYLPKKASYQIADTLMPTCEDNSIFAPSGFERLALTVLSANMATTALFVWVSANSIGELLGQDFQDLANLAQQNFWKIEKVLEQFLPVGIAILATLLFAIVTLTMVRAFFQTANLKVCRAGGVILCRGGILTKIERRINVQSITACDTRVSPVARILGRYPLYVTVGSFTGGEFPIMVYKRKNKNDPAILLPEFSLPTAPLCDTARKSPPQYLGIPGTLFALSLGLCLVAYNVMPDTLPMLSVLVILAVTALLVSFDGFRKEGLCKNENRTIFFVYTRFFTRHDVCVFTPDVMYSVFQNPFGTFMGYTNFYLHLPSGIVLKARGVAQYVAYNIGFIL